MKSYEIQELLNAREAHLLELKATLAASDEHALKCFKKGLVFEEAYPEDAAAYEAARLEYNRVEVEVEDLRRQLEEAKRQEEEEDE
jgi:hypothetical protein